MKNRYEYLLKGFEDILSGSSIKDDWVFVINESNGEAYNKYSKEKQSFRGVTIMSINDLMLPDETILYGLNPYVKDAEVILYSKFI